MPKFGKFARNSIKENIQKPSWPLRRKQAKKYLNITKKYFPNYVSELEGYAEGARVNFLDLWTISLEDEVHKESANRCTAIVTNKGKLISHNEDSEKNSENHICLLLKKTEK